MEIEHHRIVLIDIVSVGIRYAYCGIHVVLTIT